MRAIINLSKMCTTKAINLYMLTGLLWALSLWGDAFASTQTPQSIRDDLFISVQRGMTSVAAKALVQSALRQQAGNPELSKILRQRQDLLKRQKGRQKELTVSLSKQGIEAETTVAHVQSKIDENKLKIEKLDQELDQNFPEFKELTNPSPMSVSEVQSQLRDNEAMIMTLTEQSNVYVWAISKTSADWSRADISRDDLDAQVRLLRKLLDVTSQNRSAVALDDGFVASAEPFDRALAYQLYQKLLQPLAHVFGPADHLITIVDGPLTSLPLAILIASEPETTNDGNADLRDTDWLIKKYALTTLPNVSSLRAIRRSASSKSGKTHKRAFVGFGDPILGYQANESDDTHQASPTKDDAIHTRGVYQQVAKVANLAPLPNTAKELRALAKVTGARDQDIYLREQATEKAVKQANLTDVRVLAFATHGLLAGGLKGLTEPALVFTPPNEPNQLDDALLTASEAASLKLSADLIILSACNTAASDGTPGAEGLSGLARSFLYAGARSILVSHWPVDDYATSVLTTGMLSHMTGAEAISRSQALRHSILELMQDQKDARHAHPRYWAPFILVGEGQL